MIKFGKAIRLYREKAGLSQASLADKADIVAHYLSAIENDRKEPSMALIRTIGRKLKVAPEVLFWEAIQLEKNLPRADRKTIELAKVLDRHYYEAD